MGELIFRKSDHKLPSPNYVHDTGYVRLQKTNDS